MMATGTTHEVDRVGIANPKQVLVDALGPGEIGFLTASIKSVAECKVGDTLTDAKAGAVAPLPGFQPTVPVVFCGLFPVEAADYVALRDSLGKLALNDSRLTYEPASSSALGFGFRCGCL